ncbi:hypothetical protein VM1G_01978 [Cytospora mali]|uniref:Uncharacterized protein n=1 Tax=Cytospora mali TaxID=578113 RepID=A0A194VQ08_CYTMA|nr:hypothetical protein VM1G_01978 [Valsa mali]
MAAPPEKTLRDLTGVWVMNKTLSDSADPALALQGVGWLTRKAIGLATVTLHTKEYVDEQGVTHIDVQQTATGGVKGNTENRTLDDTFREHTDWLFGHVKGRTGWVASKAEIGDGTDAFLTDGWEEGQTEWIVSNVESLDRGWTVRQVWGFRDVNGERRYARNTVVAKGDERVELRLVYDYVPEQA